MRKRTRTTQFLPDAGHAAVGALSVFLFTFPVPFVSVSFDDLKSFI